MYIRNLNNAWAKKGKVHKAQLAILCFFLISGCTASHRYQNLVAEHRKEDKSRQQKIEALSRENAVLHEEKAELQRDVGMLGERLGKTHQKHDQDKAAFKSHKSESERKIRTLGDSLAAAGERQTAVLEEVQKATAAIQDSLKRRIQTLESAMQRKEASLARENRDLKSELAKLKSDYEKERYAWERIKEELFKKLGDRERDVRKSALGEKVSQPAADTIPAK